MRTSRPYSTTAKRPSAPVMCVTITFVAKGTSETKSRKDQVQPKRQGIAPLHDPGKPCMGEPRTADECKTDEVAQKVGPGFGKCSRRHRPFSGHRKFEDQQRDGNRKNAIGEGIEAIKRKILPF